MIVKLKLYHNKMEELIERLKKSCEDLELISELTSKYRDNKVVANMLLNKKIEDGILCKLHTATIDQLQKLKSDFSPFGYKFKYYDEKMIDRLIDTQILKTARKQKLDLINLI